MATAALQQRNSKCFLWFILHRMILILRNRKFGSIVRECSITFLFFSEKTGDSGLWRWRCAWFLSLPVHTYLYHFSTSKHIHTYIHTHLYSIKSYNHIYITFIRDTINFEKNIFLKKTCQIWDIFILFLTTSWKTWNEVFSLQKLVCCAFWDGRSILRYFWNICGLWQWILVHR